MKKEDLLLYGITDRYWLDGRNLADDVELAQRRNNNAPAS